MTSRQLRDATLLAHDDWADLHDLAQQMDIDEGVAVVTPYEMRCMRNHLVECFDDSEYHYIITSSENDLLTQMFYYHSGFMDCYDYGCDALRSAVHARYS